MIIVTVAPEKLRKGARLAMNRYRKPQKVEERGTISDESLPQTPKIQKEGHD